MKVKERGFTETEKILLDFISDDYANNIKAPRQADLAERLFESKRADYQDISSAQSTASRILKRLVQWGVIIRNNEKRYVPFTVMDEREIIKEQIHAQVEFARKSIFVISSSTVIIPVSAKSLHTARTLFMQYLGEIDCYDILELNGYLLVMLTGYNFEKVTYPVQEQCISGEEQTEEADGQHEGDKQLHHNSKASYLKALRKQLADIVKTAPLNAETI